MNTDRRFLNYKEYENFLRDLIDGKISEDSIIFIQDKRCIWARGKEYTGNLILDYNKDTKIVTLKTADGESIVSFVDKDEYTGFKSQFINFVNVEYLPFKNNVYTQFTVSTQNALSELDNRVDGLRQQLETVSANIPDVSNKADKDELFSGSYNDLTDKPNIPTVPTNVSAFTNDSGYLVAVDIAGKADKADTYTKDEVDQIIEEVEAGQGSSSTAQVQSDWGETDTGEPSFIKNKPTNVSAFTNDAGYITSADVENTGTTIEACSEDTFNQLETNGAIRNDICYFIFKES